MTVQKRKKEKEKVATPVEATTWPETAMRAGTTAKAKAQHTSTGTATNVAGMGTTGQTAELARGKEKEKLTKKGSPPGAANQRKTKTNGQNKQKAGKEGARKSAELSKMFVCEVRKEDDYFGKITIDSGAEVCVAPPLWRPQ